MSSSRCVRWTPTSEQLMVLEELYRKGLRNPKASQIDSITSYLAAFGKIQNKNVLYWFQNHKARERQRIRNKLYQQHQMELQIQSSYQQQQQLNTSSGMQFLSHCLAAQNQVATTGLEKHVLWGDPSVGSPARTDVIMILDVGHTTACRPGSPPETLELFPLRPPNIDEDQEVTAE